MKIVFSPEAENDLIEIWLYIAEDNPAKATELIDILKETCIFLSENPKAGTKRDYLKQGLRHFPIKNRAIYYQTKNSNVLEVVRVLHGSRDIKKHF